MIARLIALVGPQSAPGLRRHGLGGRRPGIYALRTLPLDAIPDLSDVQVIVFTDYPGQAPQVVEDQVTYPLTTSMLTVPKSKVVRGFSFFGVSFVYVIFEDGTDPYWARSRVLEYLNAAASRLPDGVSPALGPDATGVGWVYQYAVVAKEQTLADLRSLQDWVVRFAASKAEGVSEVASVGGFVKQYSIVVDPARMRAQSVTAFGDRRGRARQQHGHRRPNGRDLRIRVHGARPRLSQERRRHRRHRAENRRRRAAAPRRCGQRADRSRRTPRHRRAQRRRRSR